MFDNSLFTQLSDFGSKGGAIYNRGCSPDIYLCTFKFNYAKNGGAICNFDKDPYLSSPRILNCVFDQNAGAGFAAIFDYKGTTIISECTFTGNAQAISGLIAHGTITSCKFIGNGSLSRGGAMKLVGCYYKIKNCYFSSNFGYGGGAVYMDLSNYTAGQGCVFENCLFTANSGGYGGGAIYAQYATFTLANCTIVNNTATEGAGIYTQSTGQFIFAYVAVKINNTIIHSNNGADLTFSPDDPTVAFPDFSTRPIVKNSIIGNLAAFTTQTAIDGGANQLGVNPLFNANYSLSFCSPGINAGKNSLLPGYDIDLANNPRVFNGTIDIGCFELQSGVTPPRTFLPPVSVCPGGSAVIWGVVRTIPGTYSKTFTTTSGCDSIVSVVFSINPTPAAIVSYTDNCGTSGKILISPTVGTAPFAITLNGNTQSIAAGGSATYILAAGTYAYNITDAKGCVKNGSATLITYNITQNTLYVDARATGSNSGLNWADAFTNLQSALDAGNCSIFTQIFVSEGTYIPIKNSAGNVDLSRSVCFRMYNGITIYGGFSTAKGHTTLGSRNWKLNPTILSGELQNDGIDNNNAYNVINNFNIGINPTAVLDGFTISDAYNNASGEGGAIINANASPTIINCVIKGNFAGGVANARGAGMHSINGAPFIKNCSFLNNYTSGDVTAFGSGMSNFNSAPNISNSIFDGNIVAAPHAVGGGMYSYNGAPIYLDNSLFINNNGAAICTDGNTMFMNGTTITKNSGSLTVGAGGYYSIGGSSFVTNTIIYGNTGSSVNNIVTTTLGATFFYCDIEGSGAPTAWPTSFGENGGGNRDQNPRFNTDFTLGTCSPCANTGVPGYSTLTTDLAGNPRNVAGLDLGCYERQSTQTYSGIVYVNATAMGANTGLSWADAFTDLQAALDLDCFPVTQIWVAKGTYYPTTTPGKTKVTTPFATFQMKNNLAIYGGFSPADGVTSFANRNWNFYATILSGDIQRDGVNSNNAYNVINNYATGLNNTAVLDGFTIKDAFNTFDAGAGITLGAGIINYQSSPTFTNCIISDNVNFSTNQAFGGGMYNKDCSPTITRCRFYNNSVSGSLLTYGAGMANVNSSPVIQACEFNGNKCLGLNSVGGAIYNFGGAPVFLDNSLLVNNLGGAICTDGNSMTIRNSTIANNIGTNNNGSALYSLNNAGNVYNTIIYNNQGTSITTFNSSTTYAYSDVEGSGAPATWNTSYGINFGANKDLDPKFTLGYGLTTCSPALNAGTLAFGLAANDLAGNARIIYGAVDMGAYEFNGELPSAYGSIIYVNAAATGLRTGKNWADALIDLQDGIELAKCAGASQIWVSQGSL